MATTRLKRLRFWQRHKSRAQLEWLLHMYTAKSYTRAGMIGRHGSVTRSLGWFSQEKKNTKTRHHYDNMRQQRATGRARGVYSEEKGVVQHSVVLAQHGFTALSKHHFRDRQGKCDSYTSGLIRFRGVTGSDKFILSFINTCAHTFDSLLFYCDVPRARASDPWNLAISKSVIKVVNTCMLVMMILSCAINTPLLAL